MTSWQLSEYALRKGLSEQELEDVLLELSMTVSS